jgi:hypothetical protein
MAPNSHPRPLLILNVQKKTYKNFAESYDLLSIFMEEKNVKITV